LNNSASKRVLDLLEYLLELVKLTGWKVVIDTITIRYDMIVCI